MKTLSPNEIVRTDFNKSEASRTILVDSLPGRTAPFRFVNPRIIHEGPPLAVENAVKLLKYSGHGAVDPTEGAIWRVECDGHIDVLAKYVCPEKQIGCFLPERPGQKPVWNWKPA